MCSNYIQYSTSFITSAKDVMGLFFLVQTIYESDNKQQYWLTQLEKETFVIYELVCLSAALLRNYWSIIKMVKGSGIEPMQMCNELKLDDI